jgi:hypothetical protein
MKSMIVIALALTSVASFSATTNTKACANLKGAELKACEAKNVKTAPVAETKAVAAPVVAKDVKDAKKDAPVVTAKNVKAAAATTAPVTKK